MIHTIFPFFSIIWSSGENTPSQPTTWQNKEREEYGPIFVWKDTRHDGFVELSTQNLLQRYLFQHDPKYWLQKVTFEKQCTIFHWYKKCQLIIGLHDWCVLALASLRFSLRCFLTVSSFSKVRIGSACAHVHRDVRDRTTFLTSALVSLERARVCSHKSTLKGQNLWNRELHFRHSAPSINKVK